MRIWFLKSRYIRSVLESESSITLSIKKVNRSLKIFEACIKTFFFLKFQQNSMIQNLIIYIENICILFNWYFDDPLYLITVGSEMHDI